MNELISRQQAIEAIEKCHKMCCREDACGDEWIHYETVLNEVECIPPAEPKRGTWISSDTDGFVCSVCQNGYRNQPTLMGKPMFEFCPVCGAKMEGTT